MVSCKIPILATRVRFPGGAVFCTWDPFKEKKHLPDGESNPGLLRDRQGSLPLDYRGLDGVQSFICFEKKIGHVVANISLWNSLMTGMAVVAEWLRRLTRNQIPSGSVGSNPTDCVRLLMLLKVIETCNVSASL